MGVRGLPHPSGPSQSLPGVALPNTSPLTTGYSHRRFSCPLQTSSQEKRYSRYPSPHPRQQQKCSDLSILYVVEPTKGEYGHGQHETNVKYTDILSMADRHIIYKQCAKEVLATTFTPPFLLWCCSHPFCVHSWLRSSASPSPSWPSLMKINRAVAATSI